MTPANTEQVSCPRRNGVLLLLTVGALVVVAHWPVLQAQALFVDDDEYLVNNRLVQNPSWQSAGRFVGEVLAPSSVKGYYQPLTMVSLMLDCAAGGRPGHLEAFHRTSLALHTANTLLLVILIYKLLGNVTAAAAVGAIFGLHPMSVEPVAWIGDRKTCLAAFFALLSLLAYAGYARRGRWWRYALCAGLYILALMSKPTTTLLPGAMLLLDFWPLRRLSWRMVVEKLPLFAIAIASAIITFVSQRSTAGVQLPNEASRLSILLGIAHNIIFYPSKMLWPAHLCSLYLQPEPMSLANPAILVGAIGTLLLLIVLIVCLRWTRAPLTGWLIFFALILPTMGGIGFTFVIASDKYAYLPAFGFLLVLAAGLAAGWKWLSQRMPGPRATIVAAVVLGGVLAAELIATRAYIQQWSNTETLLRYIIPQVRDASIPYNNLGVELMRQKRWPEAADAFTRSLAQHPEHSTAQNNLGLILLRQGNAPAAAERFTLAIKYDAGYAKAYANLAMALEQQGRIPEAVAQYNASLALEPDDANTCNNLGALYARQGQMPEAITLFTRAIQLAPDYAPARENLQRARQLQQAAAQSNSAPS